MNRSDKQKFNLFWNKAKQNCSVKNCPVPINRKIALNRIKQFNAKNGRLQLGMAEAIFQFGQDYFENPGGSKRDAKDDAEHFETSDNWKYSINFTENIDCHRWYKREHGSLKRDSLGGQLSNTTVKKSRKAKPKWVSLNS